VTTARPAHEPLSIVIDAFSQLPGRRRDGTFQRRGKFDAQGRDSRVGCLANSARVLNFGGHENGARAKNVHHDW
jgi:hypothetical protein